MVALDSCCLLLFQRVLVFACESSIKEGELTILSKDMLRKYCLLVQNRSLKGYSTKIQNAINYIDFNLSQPLSLMYKNNA